MNTATLVAIVVVLVVAGVAWLLLKGRKRDADLPEVVPPPIEAAVEPVPEAAPAPVLAAPPAPPVRVAPPSPPVAATPPPAPKPAQVVVAKAQPLASPPPESVTVILAKPRPPVPVVERVLVLEQVDEAEWNAARPLALSAVQGAAVASAMTAATQPRPGESTVHAVRFDAGSAIRIARGDIETLRAVAAACAASGRGKAHWLDSAAATALAATALAALASERWLDALGDEMRDLKASVAALPPKLAAQGEGRLKALLQDLSRFAREARDNYVSVIGKFAFRERIGEGCERAAEVWHGLVASADALREQLDGIAKVQRFGEAQVERSLVLWRELQEQERLLEIAARVLAGMHTLRQALGDATAGTGADPLASAAAALQVGLEQDRELVARLLAKEKEAKGDPYVGKREFEASRAALRKALDKPIGDAMTVARSRLHDAAAAGPLDAGVGAPSRLLVHSTLGESAAALRWSDAPHSG